MQTFYETARQYKRTIPTLQTQIKGFASGNGMPPSWFNSAKECKLFESGRAHSFDELLLAFRNANSSVSCFWACACLMGGMCSFTTHLQYSFHVLFSTHLCTSLSQRHCPSSHAPMCVGRRRRSRRRSRSAEPAATKAQEGSRSLISENVLLGNLFPRTGFLELNFWEQVSRKSISENMVLGHRFLTKGFSGVHFRKRCSQKSLFLRSGFSEINFRKWGSRTVISEHLFSKRDVLQCAFQNLFSEHFLFIHLCLNTCFQFCFANSRLFGTRCSTTWFSKLDSENLLFEHLFIETCFVE